MSGLWLFMMCYNVTYSCFPQEIWAGRRQWWRRVFLNIFGFSYHYDLEQINFFFFSLLCVCSGLFCLFSYSQFSYYVDLSFCLTVFTPLSTAHMCLLMLIFISLDLAPFPEAREFRAYACPQLLRSYVCGRHRQGSEFREFNMQLTFCE